MFRFGIDHLTTEILFQLLDGKILGELTGKAIEQINACRTSVEKMATGNKAVYGLNTGFGPLCDTRISATETHQLQHNLLLTHAVGVGEYIEPQLSKMMLICKVHGLSRGFSGIRLETIKRILYFIEHDLIPCVPEQGSVGASGDLAPLSHLFLPLIGEGAFWADGKMKPAMNVLRAHGLEPLKLHSKEGLALINGTQFILAHAVKGIDQMGYLLDLADVAGAMSLEGAQGSKAPFREELHQLRPFHGSLVVAKRMRKLLDDSENMTSHVNCERVQDPYSLRCIPQVHGASRNAWNHLKELVDIELNSVTDNPVIINETEAISGGNFHGQPLAIALDYVSIGAAELGNISDRRCYLLLEGKYGLPRLLTKNSGLNSGLMIPQYTTAALVSENKSLCFPPSADSIPTSLGQEDHVSMGSISARKFNQIVKNLEKILAIELLLASQALSFRRPMHFSEIIEKNERIIREKIPIIEDDRLLKADIDKMVELVHKRNIDVKIDELNHDFSRTDIARDTL